MRHTGITTTATGVNLLGADHDMMKELCDEIH